MTSSWFFLSALNYDARSTTHQMQIFIYCYITLHVSGVHCAHHQEYMKLVAASRTDLCQRLQLQFYGLLMMGAMDARNM